MEDKNINEKEYQYMKYVDKLRFLDTYFSLILGEQNWINKFYSYCRNLERFRNVNLKIKIMLRNAFLPIRMREKFRRTDAKKRLMFSVDDNMMLADTVTFLPFQSNSSVVLSKVEIMTEGVNIAIITNWINIKLPVNSHNLAFVC